MREKERQVRVFSILAALIMIFSLITPGLTFAEINGKINHSLNDPKVNGRDKISSSLQDQLDSENKVTFLIKLTEKADTIKVAQEAKSKAHSANLSKMEEEHMQRSAVVSELKQTAMASQQNVLQFLKKEEKKGNAEEIRPYYIVNGVAVTATKEVAEKIVSFEEVEKILPNETRQLISAVDTDSKIPENKSGDTEIEWNVERVHAPEVWGMGIDGTGTVVASIDSGVQWDHPALKNKYRGYHPETEEVDHDFNWYDAIAGEPIPYDDVGHGTHVTGTMAGSEPNGTNQVGVAPGANWIAVKAFTEDGGSDTDLLDAAEWILAPADSEGNTRVDLAPDVVNNSWGGGPGLDEWYRDVVQNWRSADIFPMFSVGNTTLFNPGGPESAAAPANYPESFAAGATDINDELAGFSLQGPSPYDEIKPDVSAPGVDIRSTVPDNDYAVKSGTSMASPAVAAVAAMLRQANSNLTVTEIEEILLNTATSLTDDQFPDAPNHGYGYGLVNAYEAVSFILNEPGKINGKVTEENNNNKRNRLINSNDNLDIANKKFRESDIIPLAAKITVLESGRSVNTDPTTGTYSLLHEAGSFTLEAEAYGYYSEKETINLENDETTTVDFALEEMEQSTISGRITDTITGKGISGATLFLIEDANVEPIETDVNGDYNLTLYEGNYTLKVMAQGYHGKELDITVDETDQKLNISLEPFYTYPGGEIGYDDGTAENALANLNSGNAYAVKISLPEDKDSAVVTDGVFKFWDESFPDPGGTEFAVEIWNSAGEDGFPGERIAGPFYADAIRDLNEWTIVDLSAHNIIVDDDFYMVYMQTGNNPYVPGIATDEDGVFANRSYQYFKSNDTWTQSTDYWGNFMIRARVAYEIDIPEITSPADGKITNKAAVTVEGNASPETNVKLFNNGEEIGSIEIGDDGTFSINTNLVEGENELTAITLKDGEEITESLPIKVTLDTESPDLMIDNPADGEKTNRETATVEGNVVDENPDIVTVNGQEATVSEDGSFSQRVLLEEGENVVEVMATDLAGNSTTETITIFADYTAPEILNLTPDEDVELETGQSVMVEFESEPGLRTSFVVHMPLTDFGLSTMNATELPMMETAPGNYVGYWTVPRNAYADGAVMEVIAKDRFGNETREHADGRLFINLE